MTDASTVHDLDEWMLKLDSLQKALKSCSSKQLCRLQSPILRARANKSQVCTPVINDSGIELSHSDLLHTSHSHSPAEGPLRQRIPQSPGCGAYPGAKIRRSGENSPPLRHRNRPDEPAQLPRDNISLDRLDGMRKLVSDLDSVEIDLASSAADYSKKAGQFVLRALRE
ncbi:unnamed protein product [Mesocestoides corti]|uniref:Uncharacterized protein n=1 Tax=Mesocestoides corti TaxID=53468 RepID=A0A0R3UHL2_MESCO|nr:unnamed protein product [Mesocestoides corti]